MATTCAIDYVETPQCRSAEQVPDSDVSKKGMNKSSISICKDSVVGKGRKGQGGVSHRLAAILRSMSTAITSSGTLEWMHIPRILPEDRKGYSPIKISDNAAKYWNIKKTLNR